MGPLQADLTGPLSPRARLAARMAEDQSLVANLLTLLERKGGCTLTVIGDELGLTRWHTEALVTGVVDKGLAHRRGAHRWMTIHAGPASSPAPPFAIRMSDTEIEARVLILLTGVPSLTATELWQGVGPEAHHVRIEAVTEGLVKANRIYIRREPGIRRFFLGPDPNGPVRETARPRDGFHNYPAGERFEDHPGGVTVSAEDRSPWEGRPRDGFTAWATGRVPEMMRSKEASKVTGYISMEDLGYRRRPKVVPAHLRTEEA